MIRPDVLASNKPYGPYQSKGSDLWEMFQAAAVGDNSALEELLAKDPDLVHGEYWYTQPLHFAVREGHADACRLLLSAGADPSASGTGSEDLVTMARDRHFGEIAQLLEEARNAKARTAPSPVVDHPIHAAAAKGDAQAVKTLLGQDPVLVHRGDRMGGTPLHRAVAASSHETIEILLTHGADVKARFGSGPGDASGYAPVDFEPVDLALWTGPFWNVRGDLTTVRLLLDHGAEKDVVIAAALGEEDQIRQWLAEDPQLISAARPCGKRALSTAVEFGQDGIAELLLSRGADPNWREGSTAPLGVALHAASRTGNLPMVKRLLASGADPNGFIDSSGSAVYVAKSGEIRSLLMAKGGELDAFDMVWLGEDETLLRGVRENPQWANGGCGGALAAACTLNKKDLLLQLLAAGAKVPPVLTECRSYLLHSPELLKILLDQGAMDPNLPNWQGATPLHDLCGRDGRGRPMAERVPCAESLIEAGADLSARDHTYKSTPLAWAARENLPDMVELLLRRGAPLTLPDDEPWATPKAWAERRGHQKILALIGGRLED